MDDERANDAEPRRGRNLTRTPGWEQRAQRVARFRARRAQRDGQSASAGSADEDRHDALPQVSKTATPRRRIEQRLSTVAPRRMTTVEAARGPYLLPPPAARNSHIGTYIGFGVCVVLPTIVAAIYYGLIASSQYIAEFRFSVQDTQSTSMPMPTGMPSILTSSTGSSANNNYLVTDFLGSREAVDELQRRIGVVGLYSKPNIDWWARFNASKPIEYFVPYWQSVMTATYDQVTGLATVTVRAFSPQDALQVADTMVKLSEELVNKIANRSQRDAVRYAEAEVEKAQERLKANRVKLTEYRNRSGLIDPTTSVGASNAALIQTLRANLAQLETQLATLTSQNLTPNAPAIVTLRNQINSTRAQLASTEADVGRGVTGAALSKVVGEYEQLNADVQFAQSMVTSTMQALDQARASANSQHLYITPYVRPSLPQSSSYPRPVTATLAAAGLSFALWMIALLILRSIRERFA